MAETKHVAFRLGEKLVGKLDLEARRLTRETGFEVSRTDVLKRLITEHCGKPRKQEVGKRMHITGKVTDSFETPPARSKRPAKK